ncbi:MAG: EamA family transporter [Planctomycetaceae bacterium]|nr:EamA family transporter [Planctomycetaceae bacterium]
MTNAADSSRGRLLVVAAALFWSTNGLFVKNGVFESWPSEQRGMLLALWRGLFAALVLIPLVRKPRWSWKLLPLCAAFLGMNICFLQSMVWTTAGNAIWLQNIAPVWVCLFARFAGEPLDRRDLVPLVFSVVGVGLILTCELSGTDWSGTAPQGVLLGLLSGLFYAVVIHTLRRLREFDAAWLIVLSLGVTALCLSPLPVRWNIWPTSTQWITLIAFGAVQMATPYFLFARGLRKISGQEGAAIGLLEPLLVPLWVWNTEQPRWWTIAGGGLIFLGLAWRYLMPLVRLGRR